jgi:hypothetical protein
MNPEITDGDRAAARHANRRAWGADEGTTTPEQMRDARLAAEHHWATDWRDFCPEFAEEQGVR